MHQILLSIPSNCDLISMENNQFYCWFENDILYFFPSEKTFSENSFELCKNISDLRKYSDSMDFQLIKIHRNDIDYYIVKGSEWDSTDSYSSGGGTNLKGAVVGGILAGGAGAIIGSNHKREVKTHTFTTHHDNRYLELFYRDNQKTVKKIINYTAYALFEKWFPEKEYEYINSIGNNIAEETNDKFAQIQKYKELLDNNIITVEEFEKKKKELLNL